MTSSPTALMEQVLPTLRVELASAATTGRTVTHGQASAAISRAYIPQGMGPLLTALGHRCAERGEPNLAALVVDAADAAHVDGAGERRRVWRHWGGEAAERTGVAREAAGLTGTDE